jgi:tetratricopeptide (TPR) repeat protein
MCVRSVFGWLMAAVVLVAGCASDPQTAKRRHVEKGDAYVAQKQYAEAIIEYRNALQVDARAGDVRLRLSQAYMQINDVTNAYREAVRAADLLPNDAAAQIHATNFLLMAGQYEDAKTRAERLLKRDPTNVDAQLLVGYATAGLRDFDGAIAQIEEAIGLKPDRADILSNLGMIHLVKGDRVRAEAALKKALEIEPRSIPARLALANFYWSTGRIPDAETTLKQAINIDARDPRANRALAALYRATNRAADAEPLLAAVVKETTDVAPRLALADYYLSMKRSTDALKLLESLPVTPAVRSAVRSRIAQAQYALGHSTEAYKTIDDLLAAEPNSVMAMVTRGRLLMQDDKPKDALNYAAAAVQADPKSVAARYTFGTASMLTGDTDAAIGAFSEVLKLNPRAADAQVQLSRLQLEQRRVDDSLKLAGQAVRIQPTNLDAHLLVARGLIARGDLKAAETQVDELLNAAPTTPAVHTLAGHLHLARKDPAAARTSFERALQLDAHFVEAIAGLVALDLQAKRPSDAIARLDASLASANTPSPALLMLAAKTYLRTGNASKGEDALRRLADVDQTSIEAYTMLGQLYMQQNRLDDASVEFAALGRRQPNSVLAYTMSGTIAYLQGKRDAAAASYQHVLAIDPQAPVAANNLAWLTAEHEGNLDVALELASTAKRQLPDEPNVNDTLGWIYYKKNLPQLAVVPLQESVTRDPQNPVFHYHLGLAYAKLGDKPKARRALEGALKLNDHFDGAGEARKVLESLGA